MRNFAVAACLLALAGIVATGAMADDGAAAGDDTQLLDVSKQVSGIEKKLNELLAHGQWARAGKLLSTVVGR